MNAKQLAQKQRRWKTIGTVILHLPIWILLSPLCVVGVVVGVVWFVANLLVMSVLAVVWPAQKRWLKENIQTVEAGNGETLPLPSIGVVIPPCPAYYARPGKHVADEWSDLCKAIRAGDEIWTYCSSPYSWRRLMGRAGYALVRRGRVIEHVVIVMN